MKNLIILAGYPATGKTCIINGLIEHNKKLEYISIDEIEEFFYDNLGFKNKKEKKRSKKGKWAVIVFILYLLSFLADLVPEAFTHIEDFINQILNGLNF